ncbi:MAG TPA: sugar ABC transporter permease [Candidatus Sumerlaeota bacterium]|nr:sugar ABC transporter permease [Candidatus Sumerlaeota bacterium]HOR29675.1 sugar ABC transporter permease [Candidatus Sumerlaeota bacterium]HPK02022.1 sugar ABC transporter permease [Candidatus Sumerlaeota bacterium]
MKHWAQQRMIYGLAAVPALLFLLFQIWPLGHAIQTAFTNETGQWTLEPARRVWGDPLFRRSLGYSFLIPVVSVALEAGAGVAMALWFYFGLGRARGFWRTIALIPFAVPEIVYLLTMKLVFRQNGYLNSLLWHVGGSEATVGWLEPGTPLMVGVVILVDAWRVTPIVLLIVLAALEQVPESYLEAARIDGASVGQIAWRILMPLILPALLVALALRAVDAFRIFATPLVLVGIDALPVLTSVAYHYQEFARDGAAANVAALTLAFTLLLLTGLTLLGMKRRRSS